MKKNGEISAYFRLKHHVEKKSDIFPCSVSKIIKAPQALHNTPPLLGHQKLCCEIYNA